MRRRREERGGGIQSRGVVEAEASRRAVAASTAVMQKIIKAKKVKATDKTKLTEKHPSMRVSYFNAYSFFLSASLYQCRECFPSFSLLPSSPVSPLPLPPLHSETLPSGLEQKRRETTSTKGKDGGREGRKEGRREGGREGGRERRLPQLDVHPTVGGGARAVGLEPGGDLLAEEGRRHLLDHAVGLERGRERETKGRM